MNEEFPLFDEEVPVPTKRALRKRKEEPDSLQYCTDYKPPPKPQKSVVQKKGYHVAAVNKQGDTYVIDVAMHWKQQRTIRLHINQKYLGVEGTAQGESTRPASSYDDRPPQAKLIGPTIHDGELFLEVSTPGGDFEVPLDPGTILCIRSMAEESAFD